ncbi:hypothetical protein TWF730_004875 [Orbilia blumenaviensis]|uniref:Uncharacterized protein n=1 Tax=Orbilia blumenaviensis TaxID=1796055 RepID=A0AAV9VH05_9PEZI
MKYHTVGFYIASLAIALVANCQSLDPAWGVGHYGGDVGLWYPRSSTTTIPGSSSTSIASSSSSTFRASKNEKAPPFTSTTSSEIESTSTTTKYVTRTTTITVPVTMSTRPA